MDLTNARLQIDTLDDTIEQAFIRRMELSEEIARAKKELGLPITNKNRERQILSQVMAKAPSLSLYTHRLFNTLFELSKAYQASQDTQDSPLKASIRDSLLGSETLLPSEGTVACQGVEGAYSQMAADKLFPRGSLTFFKSFDAVFDAVENDFCTYGVVPIENSSNGSVKAVYQLLKSRNVSIIRSLRLCISHQLLAKPGARLEDITEIRSHEQALGQCSQFLKSLGDKVRVIPAPNTAMAAEYVSKSPDRGAACISSMSCAELYGLVPIEAKIQNSDNNYTRFVCITKKPLVYPGANRISLIVSLAHRPGALYDVLAQFAANEVNLLKLESYPVVGHDFEFSFFLESEASVRDPKIVGMLGELQRMSTSFRYLGNYIEG